MKGIILFSLIVVLLTACSRIIKPNPIYKTSKMEYLILQDRAYLINDDTYYCKAEFHTNHQFEDGFYKLEAYFRNQFENTIFYFYAIYNHQDSALYFKIINADTGIVGLGDKENIDHLLNKKMIIIDDSVREISSENFEKFWNEETGLINFLWDFKNFEEKKNFRKRI